MPRTSQFQPSISSNCRFDTVDKLRETRACLQDIEVSPGSLDIQISPPISFSA